MPTEEYASEKNTKKEKDVPVYATLIGVVQEVRDITTKSGGNMLIATVESVGFDFRIVVFARDYETYAKKLQVDQIVVADGRLRFDDERGEISLSPGGGFGKK